MYRFLPALGAAALVLTSPAIARAAESKASMAATVVCRPATATEHGNAMMMAGHAMMMCKPIAIVTAGKKSTFGPDLSKALTSEQIDTAWRAWISKELSVLPAGN